MRLPKPLRCDDVTGALSAPRAAIDLPGLAEHLAECPSCAAQVERDAALTRLWESTRPLEPSAETWNTIWAGVCDRLDAQPVTIPLRPRQRHTAIAFITAQAAAVLAAFVLWAAHRPAVDAVSAPPRHQLMGVAGPRQDRDRLGRTRRDPSRRSRLTHSRASSRRASERGRSVGLVQRRRSDGGNDPCPDATGLSGSRPRRSRPSLPPSVSCCWPSSQAPSACAGRPWTPPRGRSRSSA